MYPAPTEPSCYLVWEWFQCVQHTDIHIVTSIVLIIMLTDILSLVTGRENIKEMRIPTDNQSWNFTVVIIKADILAEETGGSLPLIIIFIMF